MGVALGARALLDNAVPTGVDTGVLFERGMEEGIATGDILQLAAAMTGGKNEELENRYAGIITFTERDYSRYRQGEAGRSPTPLKSEFAAEDGKRAQKIGHMLPRNDFHDEVHYTKEYLERGVREDVRDDIAVVNDSWDDRVDLDVIRRLLSAEEDLVGTSGYSPGWAVGSGVNVPFIPPKRGNITFDSSHTQYLRHNGAFNNTNLATVLNNAARLLSRLGHTGRKLCLVSEADVATYTSLDSKQFVRFIPAGFEVNTGASDIIRAQGELTGVPGEIFGYWLSSYGVIELRYHERIPTTYGWMGKSYGTNSPRNPLAARIESKGFGLMIDPEFRMGTLPRLQKLDFDATHGIGVNDRTNGVAFQIATGGSTYTNPDIE